MYDYVNFCIMMKRNDTFLYKHYSRNEASLPTWGYDSHVIYTFKYETTDATQTNRGIGWFLICRSYLN